MRRPSTERMRAAAVLLAMSGFPLGLEAQRDSIRVTVIRATTPFEQRVERLARTLVGQQQRVGQLVGTRDQLVVTLRSVPEGQRDQVAARLRIVESELASLNASRVSLRRQLEELCAPAQAADGWLGVAFNGEYTMDATPDGVLMAVRTPPQIESVEPGSPAEKAGLRRGDIMLSMGGQELSDAVIRLNEILRPGARVPLRVKRGPDTRTVTVVIEPRPADFRPSCGWEDDLITRALSPANGSLTFVVSPRGGGAASVNPFDIEGPPPSRGTATVTRRPSGTSGYFFVAGPSSRLLAGTNLVPVNEGITAITGVERGVFVAEVARRSIAAQAGLVAGDVITAADGRAVTSPAVLAQLMERAESRELRLQVTRNRKPETIVLKW